MTEDGLTINDVFPDDPADAATNRCANQSAGEWHCTGSDEEFLPYPAGAGPWAKVIINGVPTYVPYTPPANAAPEQAPAPRENGAGESNGGQPPNLI